MSQRRKIWTDVWKSGIFQHAEAMKGRTDKKIIDRIRTMTVTLCDGQKEMTANGDR